MYLTKSLPREVPREVDHRKDAPVDLARKSPSLLICEWYISPGRRIVVAQRLLVLLHPEAVEPGRDVRARLLAAVTPRHFALPQAGVTDLHTRV